MSAVYMVVARNTTNGSDASRRSGSSCRAFLARSFTVDMLERFLQNS